MSNSYARVVSQDKVDMFDDVETVNASVVSVQQSPAVPLGNTLSNWKFDLFDICGNCKSFMTAVCCTPCVISRLGGRVRMFPGCCNTYTGFSVLTFFTFIIYWIGKTLSALPYECPKMLKLMRAGALASLLCGALIFYIVYRLRTMIRRKYNIYGDDCTDAVTTACCVPCSVAQMSREVELEPRCCCQCSAPEEYLLSTPQTVEMTNRVTVAMIV